MIYLILIMLILVISCIIILGMILHNKGSTKVKLVFNLFGIKADMEITEEKKKV
ncbi:hypothetical protein [Clostridium sp.]|uniref:hypothetical protein n=1 Tax=Clostridium sp. TaxID=1506 RepID=UPI00262D9A85|nr:hypothetical protein [Clostridium sp.]